MCGTERTKHTGRKNIKLLRHDIGTYDRERGAILVLTAISIVFIMMSAALSLDIGYIILAEAQLQNAAEAASLAGAAELIDEGFLYGDASFEDDITFARNSAESFAQLNKADNRSLALRRNDENLPDGGIVAGYIEDPNDPNSPFLTEGLSYYNSVQVKASLSQDINGPLGLFFSAFAGTNTVQVSKQATATIDDRVIGFALSDGPYGEENLMMLPFTILYDTWVEGMDGDNHPPDCACPHEPDVDDYTYDPVTGTVSPGGDGIPEMKLYPNKDGICGQEDLPGNFGTIDIGPSNNSTDDIRRQIIYGISQADLDAIGGLLMTDEGGGNFSQWLEGDTGVSTTVRFELDDIIGQPRLIPLYSVAVGNGNNTEYKIVKFVGARVMDVNMTGALQNRNVVVQPCQVSCPSAIIHPDAPHSGLVYAMALTR